MNCCIGTIPGRKINGNIKFLLGALLGVLIFLFLSFPAQAHAANNAQFISQSVPSTMVAGNTYQVSVTMKNAGSNTWTAFGNYALGSVNPLNNTTWGLNRVRLASSDVIAQNQTKTFTFNVKAPSTPGTYNFQWQMVQEGGTQFWFGSASINIAINVTAPPAVNNAQFISQSVPTHLVAGTGADISVTMKNTGTTTWCGDGSCGGIYGLRWQFSSGGPIWIWAGSIELTSDEHVLPGQSKTFNVPTTAPTTSGTYNLQSQMFSENHGSFGDPTPNVAVSVGAASTANPPDNFSITSWAVDSGQGSWYYTPAGQMAVDFSSGGGSLPAFGDRGFIPGPNQVVKADLEATTNTGMVGVQFRRAEGADGYSKHFGVYLYADKVMLHRMGTTADGISLTSVSAPFTRMANTVYHVKMVQMGNNIKVFINDVLYIDNTDTQNSSYTTGGRVALRCGSTGCRYDGVRAMSIKVDSNQGTWYSTPEGQIAVDLTSNGGQAVLDGANGFIPGPNQTVEMDLTSTTDTGMVGFHFRRAEGADGYLKHFGIFLKPTQVVIHRMGFDGAHDTVFSFTRETNRKYHVKMVQTGQNIKVFVGSEVFEDNDPQNLMYPDGGRIAFRCTGTGTGCRYDGVGANT